MREERAESSALVERGPGRYINEMRTLRYINEMRTLPFAKKTSLARIFPLLTS